LRSRGAIEEQEDDAADERGEVRMEGAAKKARTTCSETARRLIFVVIVEDGLEFP